MKNLGPAAAPLSRLTAPSCFVTGNHEYYSVGALGVPPPGPSGTGGGWRRYGGHARACSSPTSLVQIHEAVRHGVDLQLSGHTHGGQLWPGNLIAAAANPTVAGLDRYGGTQLYITVIELASTCA